MAAAAEWEHIDYVMVMVSDMARSVAFYRDVVGFKLKFDSPDWTEFLTGKTILALHGGATPAPPEQAWEGRKWAGTCSIGLSTSDLDVATKSLKDRGVRFVLEPTDQSGDGLRLAIFVDPDGMPISISQQTAR